MKISRLFLSLAFMLFFALSAVSYGASVPIDNIRQTLTEQLKESSDTEEILKGLQNVEGLTYKSRSRGNGVREFQNLLLSYGYSIGKADGAYGNKTAAAVMEFQTANNLPATGEADLITQFSLVMNNGDSLMRKGNTYITQVKNYAVIIWPGKAFYVGALDKFGNLSEGTYCYLTGGSYAGEYKNNKRYGKGTAHFTNGDSYIGQWKNDAMHGYGTYYYSGIDSAEYYTGNMDSNKMQGKGTYYSGGRKISGRWSNNQRLK